MKQDRFLTGILICIAVLVVIALVVFFLRQGSQSYISEEAPEGVVHNYVLAVLNDDYKKAYGYLADLDNKPTYEQFRDAFVKGVINPNNSAVDIGSSEVSDDTASVEVALIYNPSDPFSTGYRDVQRAVLVRQAGEWKLSSMPGYYFWDYNWYMEAKAKKIGKEKLAWWDLYAPVGKTDKVYSFDEACNFILENFEKFSPDLAAFAKRAFDNHWIDAEQREGKRGGAFCMDVQGVKESRILSNFDGSFDQVFTLAHELGHAFHNECAYQANKTVLQQLTPMTLAETASTMCETIVMEAFLASTRNSQEELAVLEAQVQNASQIVVDIYSRYLFEKEVFERRAQSELSADDFNDIMERAQKETYGDGLDERYLQKFMWTWKPHYYSPGLSFYNYPYAFGLLFATGLYAIYRQRGAAFVEDYKNLLASTGEETAAKLARRFGIDITRRKFWDDSLAIIGQRVDRYCEL